MKSLFAIDEDYKISLSYTSQNVRVVANLSNNVLVISYDGGTFYIDHQYPVSIIPVQVQLNDNQVVGVTMNILSTIVDANLPLQLVDCPREEWTSWINTYTTFESQIQRVTRYVVVLGHHRITVRMMILSVHSLLISASFVSCLPKHYFFGYLVWQSLFLLREFVKSKYPEQMSSLDFTWHFNVLKPCPMVDLNILGTGSKLANMCCMLY